MNGPSLDKRTGVPLIGGSRAPNIELAEFITVKTVEAAYVWCKEQCARGEVFGDLLAMKGLRAAEARDPKLLKALEKGAEVMVALAEDQYGRTMRDPGATFSEKTLPTEAQLWREAYATADRGTPAKELAWIYAAGAKLAGLI